MKKGSRDSRGWFSRNTRQHSWQQEEQHYVGAKSALVFNPEIKKKKTHRYLLTPAPTGQVLQLDNTDHHIIDLHRLFTAFSKSPQFG